MNLLKVLCASRSIVILSIGIVERRKETLRAGTSIKLNPLMMLGQGIKPRLQWLEATFTTAPPHFPK